MNVVIRRKKDGWIAFWYAGNSTVAWIRGHDPTRAELIANIEKYWT